MNALRLENINLHSPYRVWQTQEDSHYYFQTDTGIQYDIVFAPDTSIINSGAYTIDIVNRQHVASPVDMKLRQTIMRVHNNTTVVRTLTQPTRATGLTRLLQSVV